MADTVVDRNRAGAGGGVDNAGGSLVITGSRFLGAGAAVVLEAQWRCWPEARPSMPAAWPRHRDAP